MVPYFPDIRHVVAVMVRWYRMHPEEESGERGESDMERFLIIGGDREEPPCSGPWIKWIG